MLEYLKDIFSVKGGFMQRLSTSKDYFKCRSFDRNVPQRDKEKEISSNPKDYLFVATPYVRGGRTGQVFW